MGFIYLFFFLKSKRRSSNIPSLLGMFLLFGLLSPIFDVLSGSFKSVQWNACVHRLDLNLHFQLKEL